MRWYYTLYFYKALHTFFFIFCRKLFMWLGGPEALDFFQSVQKANYHFADVNSARNFIINRAENMFNNTRRAILFANKQTFLINDAEKDCSQSLSSTEEKLIPPFLILYSLPILSKSISKFLMKVGSLTHTHTQMVLLSNNFWLD